MWASFPLYSKLVKQIYSRQRNKTTAYKSNVVKADVPKCFSLFLWNEYKWCCCWWCCCCLSHNDNPVWLSPISLLILNYKHTLSVPHHPICCFIPDPLPLSYIIPLCVCVCVCASPRTDLFCLSNETHRCSFAPACAWICGCWCLHFFWLSCRCARHWQTDTNDLQSLSLTHTHTPTHTEKLSLMLRSKKISLIQFIKAPNLITWSKCN